MSRHASALTTARLRKLRMRIEMDQDMKRLKIRGKELDRLPRELFSLYELEILDMSPEREACLYYRLTSVPPDIGKLHNLRILMLDTNEIETLPPEIGLLSNLERISLSNNKLAVLPDGFGDLKSLRSLHMANNQFVLFPTCLCKITALEFLDMCDNQLVEIPPEINKLTNLENLHFYMNNISSLPDEICDLVRLRALWLGNNRLKELPVRFGELRDLDWGRGHMGSLSVDGNPLEEPPLEIAKKGVAYIQVYFAKKSGSAGTAKASGKAWMGKLQLIAHKRCTWFGFALFVMVISMA